MTEPVIPERYRLDFDGAWKDSQGHWIYFDDYEAKVAEQAATFLAENRAMLKDLNDWVEKAKHAEKVVTQQAAIIERLTRAMREARITAIYGCGTKQKDIRGKQFAHVVEVLDAALSKQESK